MPQDQSPGHRHHLTSRTHLRYANRVEPAASRRHWLHERGNTDNPTMQNLEHTAHLPIETPLGLASDTRPAAMHSPRVPPAAYPPDPDETHGRQTGSTRLPNDTENVTSGYTARTRRRPAITLREPSLAQQYHRLHSYLPRYDPENTALHNLSRPNSYGC